MSAPPTNGRVTNSGVYPRAVLNVLNQSSTVRLAPAAAMLLEKSPKRMAPGELLVNALKLDPYNFEVVVDTADPDFVVSVLAVVVVLIRWLTSDSESPGNATMSDDASASGLKPPVFVAPVASVT
jgi:hypothetical protein